MGLDDNALITHRLEYVAFSRPNDTIHFLTKLENFFKEDQFEQRLSDRRYTLLLAYLHCVSIFGIIAHSHEELFSEEQMWWADYEKSQLLFSPSTMLFVYHATLVLFRDQCSLQFQFSDAGHSVYVFVVRFSCGDWRPCCSRVKFRGSHDH